MAAKKSVSKALPFGGQAAREGKGPLWKFTDKNDGSFVVPDPDYVTGLYFPLFNIAGMKSSVTPQMKGDICTNFHQFLTIPQVTEDFHISRASRNVWVTVDGKEPWSATGESAFVQSSKWTSPESARVEAGFGYFSTIRENKKLGLSAKVTAYVPANNDIVEISIIEIENISGKSQAVTVTPASPLFGRSGDNNRDHRQVTSMFNEVDVTKFGVSVKARIHHDEHGHQPSSTIFGIFACDGKGTAPKEVWSNEKTFIGEGGTLDNPESIFCGLSAPKVGTYVKDGVESVSATRFAKVTLAAGKKATYIVIRAITEDRKVFEALLKKYGTAEKAQKYLADTITFWKKTLDEVAVTTGDSDFDNLMRWVAFQPFCRKVYGNSYLPDHDYGRGGRGWRDLWSDLAALFLVNPADTRTEIINSLMGIRVDGTNATIIGTKPGEFKADRNNVARTWCDHGTWPYFILRFYMDQTGDTDIFFKEITYWKDQFACRSRDIDPKWNASQGNSLLDAKGTVYKGSIFEHVLIQQLSAFYHVGKHNNLLLEGGDWNDTYDMGREKGESVCFFNWYAYNMKDMADLLDRLDAQGTHTIELISELALLLDRLPGGKKVNYGSASAKQERLKEYFETIKHTIKGNRSKIKAVDLAKDLRAKADWVSKHISSNEFIKTNEGFEYFNGHYDDNERRVDGDNKLGVRMDLTSQVLPTLFGIATDDQVGKTYKSVQKYLRNKPTGGLRLCSAFNEVKLDFGRVTGFVYGFREHGSIWAQMNVMYMYALYTRNFVREGWTVFKEMYDLCMKSEQAKCLPNMPSCFHVSGKGMSSYLTGSATWLVLGMATQVFGVRGDLGDLVINPKLVKEQFGDDGIVSMNFNMHGKRYLITYTNKKLLDWNKYSIASVAINSQPVILDQLGNSITISKAAVVKLSTKPMNKIEVVLA